MYIPRPITDVQASLGEGPIWYRHQLWWVDITGKRVHCYDPKTEKQTEIQLDEMVGTVVPRAQGGLVVALQDGFAFIDENNRLSPAGDAVDDRPEIRFNDGKCDPAGRLWAGTMGLDGKDDIGTLYMLDRDLVVHERVNNVTISNGICWSDDAKTMYYIDTPTQQVVAYDYDNVDGQIANRRVVIEIDPDEGAPDGMTIDAEGNLWIALWGGFAVVCHNPKTGQRLRKIDLPCEQVTACAFGGDDLRDLYITTARADYDERKSAEQPLAGRLFRARVDVKGTESIAFVG